MRNETIKYASFKKKEQNKKEILLTDEINTIKHNLTQGNDQDNLLKRLKEKSQELQNLYDLEIKGYIIRSKANYIEGEEKIQNILQTWRKKDQMPKLYIN